MSEPVQASYEDNLIDLTKLIRSDVNQKAEVAFVSLAGRGHSDAPHENCAFAKDAEIVAAYLSNNLHCQQYNGAVFPQQAGKQTLLNALRTFFLAKKHIHQLIISRSGHMTWGPEGGWEVTDGVITLEEIVNTWHKCKSDGPDRRKSSQHLVLIMAGCFSGGWVSQVWRKCKHEEDCRYQSIVIQASATGRQIGMGRKTNGDIDAGAANQAAEAAAAAGEALQSSASYSNSDTDDADVHCQIGDALAIEAIDSVTEEDEITDDPDEKEVRDHVLRYFLKLQTQPNLRWDISGDEVVPRACQTVHPPGYKQECQAAARFGHKQFWFPYWLANGSRLYFTHVKEVPKGRQPLPIARPKPNFALPAPCGPADNQS